ncbi:hypothetical protein TWF225_012087 [Orbilia oligospora]|uniref:Uncharacterized protein n=1 Tax=Orbilia oligospora TaxID=2813651 RepID=A0A7C8KCL5_ORBOL|nr:hypothetical protein TWF751_012128 [Orbilia oligospora]KAF3195125.1 hypothetical protein TWF225_012087 [Orbilia oligospora]KAF3259480.1 hypothetical protein TWF217_012083 [Orbilia oligospora]KAF3263962.1 hypothetical protein TWF128_012074 [Orbilia oligospora]KAF3287785.1 hypothetical protein TWF132_012104 [Orbilia oligospora]
MNPTKKKKEYFKITIIIDIDNRELQAAVPTSAIRWGLCRYTYIWPAAVLFRRFLEGLGSEVGIRRQGIHVFLGFLLDSSWISIMLVGFPTKGLLDGDGRVNGLYVYAWDIMTGDWNSQIGDFVLLGLHQLRQPNKHVVDPSSFWKLVRGDAITGYISGQCIIIGGECAIRVVYILSTNRRILLNHNPWPIIDMLCTRCWLEKSIKNIDSMLVVLSAS